MSGLSIPPSYQETVEYLEELRRYRQRETAWLNDPAVATARREAYRRGEERAAYEDVEEPPATPPFRPAGTAKRAAPRVRTVQRAPRVFHRERPQTGSLEAIRAAYGLPAPIAR